MVIDYSSFTRASLIAKFSKDTTSDLFTSQVYYDVNDDVIEKFEIVEPG